MVVKGIDSRAQVTAWVILTIFIVALLLAFFIFKGKPVDQGIRDTFIRPDVEKCSTKALEEVINIILPQGGFVNPANFKTYKDINISYLCRNVGSFLPCINQHPMFLNEIKREILDYTTPRVEKCFSNMKDDYVKKGYEADVSHMNISVEMAPNRVFLDIRGKITLVKGEETKTYDNFDVGITSPAYDLINTAIVIAENEAKYCYFEYVGYMMLHPELDIKKYTMSDYTRIYSIEDKLSGKTMNIAIRSCAIPTGLGI